MSGMDATLELTRTYLQRVADADPWVTSAFNTLY